MSEYIQADVTESDINNVVILDRKHRVTLRSLSKIYAVVESEGVCWSVVKNRLSYQQVSENAGRWSPIELPKSKTFYEPCESKRVERRRPR